jgi:O-antigen/teichoic acid export membrane protein
VSKLQLNFAYSTISIVVVKVVGLISIVVISRLISPSELGVYALASSIAVLATEFRLLGVGNYIIREKELDEQKIRSSLGVALLICWGLAFSIIASSYAVAEFYNHDILASLLFILSIPFIPAPYTSVLSSLLSRSMQFREIMIIRICTALLGLTATLALVLSGYGILGLAWGGVISSLIELGATLYIFRQKEIIIKPSFKGVKPILGFGIYQSVSNFLFRFDASFPELVIGKVGTSQQVAFFSRGTGLLVFISDLLTLGFRHVALPHLSEINRAGGDIKKSYLTSTVLFSGVTLPSLIVVNVISYPLIIFMFGDQWGGAAPIASLMAFWAFFKNIHIFSHQLLVAIGQEKILVQKQLLVFIVTVSVVLGAASQNVAYIPYAMIVSGALDYLATSFILRNSIGLGFVEFIYAMKKNIIMVLTCYAAALVLSDYIDETAHYAITVIAYYAISLLIAWFLSVLLLRHPLYLGIKTLYFKFLQGRGYR